MHNLLSFPLVCSLLVHIGCLFYSPASLPSSCFCAIRRTQSCNLPPTFMMSPLLLACEIHLSLSLCPSPSHLRSSAWAVLMALIDLAVRCCFQGLLRSARRDQDGRKARRQVSGSSAPTHTLASLASPLHLLKMVWVSE